MDFVFLAALQAMDILLKCEMIIASLGDFKARNSGQTMRIIQKTPKTPMTGEVVGEEAVRRPGKNFPVA